MLTASQTTPKILIISDDRTNTRTLEDTYAIEGYKTVSAQQISQALDITKIELPNLILIDVTDNNEQGLAICEQIHQAPQTADIPVIFLSIIDDANSKVSAFNRGVVDYITKPSQQIEILARTKLHLKLAIAAKIAAAAQAEKYRQIYNAQQAMLVSPQDIPDAKFAVTYSPVHEAGGDFYDILSIGKDIFGYFVADISGHDVGASFVTPAIKALLNQYASPVYSPADVLTNVNNVITNMLSDGRHLTACYVKLNRQKSKLQFVSAGHPPVIYVPHDGSPQLLEATGDVLGAFDKVFFQSVEINVAPNDKFYLYSDGLIEGFGNNQKPREKGLEELAEACQKYSSLPIKNAVDNIYCHILSGSAMLEDDIVLLGVEV